MGVLLCRSTSERPGTESDPAGGWANAFGLVPTLSAGVDDHGHVRNLHAKLQLLDCYEEGCRRSEPKAVSTRLQARWATV